jgi:hypothetical protein
MMIAATPEDSNLAAKSSNNSQGGLLSCIRLSPLHCTDLFACSRTRRNGRWRRVAYIVELVERAFLQLPLGVVLHAAEPVGLDVCGAPNVCGLDIDVELVDEQEYLAQLGHHRR